MKYTEIETKYRADEIGLKAVIKLFDELYQRCGGQRKLEIGSWDHYYTKGEAFIRDRRGTGKERELTSKEQTDPKNNQVRKEINLSIKSKLNEYNDFMDMIGGQIHKINEIEDPQIIFKPDLDHVLLLAQEKLGYMFNFGIYKICWIYNLQDTVLVYYVVFNEDFKEVGRFMEIEANPHKDWSSEEEARNAVLTMEKEFEKIGITYRNRLPRSLFQMFKREIREKQ